MVPNTQVPPLGPRCIVMDPCFILCYEPAQNPICITLKYCQIVFWIVNTLLFLVLWGHGALISHKAFSCSNFMKNIPHTFCRYRYDVSYRSQFHFSAIQNNMLCYFNGFWSCLSLRPESGSSFLPIRLNLNSLNHQHMLFLVEPICRNASEAIIGFGLCFLSPKSDV